MEEANSRQVPLEWYIPEDLPTLYATNLVVQHTPHEFIVHFFEVHPPVLLGTPEEIEAQLEQIPVVRATCLARIVIAHDRMEGFVKALQANLEKHASEEEETK